jgi:DNA-binding NarL/FixJ family response regulator
MSAAEGVRVVVADANPLIRLGLRAALAGSPAIAVVGEAATGEALGTLIQAVRAEVVLLDVRLPGVPVIAELASLASVVVLTAAREPDTVARAIESGAIGYLVHGTYDLDQLAAAVLGAARGLPCAGPPAATALVHALRARTRAGTVAAPAGALSARERGVMALVADGLANREVGRRLGLSAKTVKNHLQSIYTKLDVHSRGAALAIWLGAERG